LQVSGVFCLQYNKITDVSVAEGNREALGALSVEVRVKSDCSLQNRTNAEGLPATLYVARPA
jgi:hypothetical protein